MPEQLAVSTFEQEIDRLEVLTREWLGLFPEAVSQGEHWQKVLAQAKAHGREDVIRVAVVGAVKSGKSTLINALVGQDRLKRGAGILTAMVTRVKVGPEARAVLRFKGWPEMAEEINRALSLLPHPGLERRTAPLSLKDPHDRELLSKVLSEGQAANLWSGGSLNQDYALLKAYLEGYDLVKGYLVAGEVLTLTGSELVRHQELVTREAMAVYLKDAFLTLPAPWLPPGLELGDCQGSDSPLPQHLAQVLAYLLKTDLVLYVISSRVGLRQADFQFLGELRRMGLAEHTCFVLNLDLTELKGGDEITGLKERVKEELAPLVPQAPLAAFSALKLLLDRRHGQAPALDPKEAALLDVWATDAETVAFHEAECRHFEAEFRSWLAGIQDRRLAGGSLPQVQMVARGLGEQADLATGLLDRDLPPLEELRARLKERRQTLDGARHSLAQALRGAGERLKGELKSRVNSFLDRRSGRAALLSAFIRDYEPDWEQLMPAGELAPFRVVLFRLFQEFQKEMSRLAAGEFNLQVVEFIRTQEDRLKRELKSVYAPISLALQEALAAYYREISPLGLHLSPPVLKGEIAFPAVRLEPPLVTLPLEPGWRWEKEAWVRTGVGFFRRSWQWVKGKLGFKAGLDPRAQQRRELERALKGIKVWLLDQVAMSLVDYGERLKFRYFFPLVDELIQGQEEYLAQLVGSLVADLESLALALRQEEAQRDVRRHRLAELASRAREVERRLAGQGQASVAPAGALTASSPTP